MGTGTKPSKYAGHRLHRVLEAIVKTASFLLRAMERLCVVLSKGAFHRSVENNGKDWRGCRTPLSRQATNRDAGGLHEDSSGGKKGIHVTCGNQYQYKLFLSYRDTSDDTYFSVLPQLTEVLLGCASNFL